MFFEVLIHQTKIGEIFTQETNTALLDDGSDYIIRLQISYMIQFIEARTYADVI